MVICRKQLEDMGFAEVSEDLWMKYVGKGIRIFRDYRNGEKKSYAYNEKNLIPKEPFNELRAIVKIEKAMAGNILA